MNLTATASTVSGLLSMATELLTWLITSMTSLITFITDNPIILMMMLITLVGLVVGYLFRIWHSVQVRLAVVIIGVALWAPHVHAGRKELIYID